MKISGIYQIENILTGKKYVGCSKNIKKRFTQHKAYLNRKKHPNSRLQSAWNEHGADIFKFSLIEAITDECGALLEREKHWINHYKSNEDGYNSRPGELGRPLSPYGETCVIRVPDFLIPMINEQIKDWKEQFKPKETQP